MLEFLSRYGQASRVTPSSFVRLGIYFVRRLVTRALTRHRGLARFERNYCREDRLLPVPAPDRRSLNVLSSCIACGLCDLHHVFDSTNRASFRGPSSLALSYTRSLPDFDSLAPYLEQLNRGNLEQLEQICPSQIPFRELVEFVEHRAAQIRASIPPPPT